MTKALLVDIDNTVYAYAPCHDAGMREAFRFSRDHGFWSDEDDFRGAYSRARRGVKTRLASGAAAHSRLLYFKEMLEAASGPAALGCFIALERAYWNGYASALAPDPGCLDVLEGDDDIVFGWDIGQDVF